jgi:hypothetical protein
MKIITDEFPHFGNGPSGGSDGDGYGGEHIMFHDPGNGYGGGDTDAGCGSGGVLDGDGFGASIEPKDTQ